MQNTAKRAVEEKKARKCFGAGGEGGEGEKERYKNRDTERQ